MAQLELKNGGEFNLLQCDLILSDGTLSNIVPAIIGLTIFEGINQFTISGTISIQDSFNLASSGPIIGHPVDPIIGHPVDRNSQSQWIEIANPNGSK